MKKELTATPTWGNYESPAIKVVEIASEGVLCASFEKYEELEFEWE